MSFMCHCAIVNTVLAAKIQCQEKKLRAKSHKTAQIHKYKKQQIVHLQLHHKKNKNNDHNFQPIKCTQVYSAMLAKKVAYDIR
jgi:hypothetical protein